MACHHGLENPQTITLPTEVFLGSRVRGGPGAEPELTFACNQAKVGFKLVSTGGIGEIKNRERERRDGRQAGEEKKER